MKLQNCCKAVKPSDFASMIAVPGRYSDVDVRNHVNNIAVAGLFSEARSQIVRAAIADGAPHEHVQFVVGQQAIFYADETLFPGSIDIGTSVLELSRSTVRFGQALFNDGNGRAMAEAVLVATAQGCPIEIPAAIRRTFEAMHFRGVEFVRQLMPLAS